MPKPNYPRLLKAGDVIEIQSNQYVNHGGRNVQAGLRGLAGKYIVEYTTMDGGGTGHGPHDIYPDGHHVHCVCVNHQDLKIDFYQTGCFINMLTVNDVKPIGKAIQKWILVA